MSCVLWARVLLERNGVRKMDSMDRSILKCLSENSRRSATDIGHTVHLSVAAVIERIHKLEKSGVIQKYTIVTDQHKIGNEVTALMEVSLEHPRFYDEFTKAMHENDNVVSCDYLTGDYDFMLKIQTQSSESLEQLHRVIKSIKGVSGTKTYFVLKEIKSGTSALAEV
jgi:Lrp/AsnC family leucine-responsive transcriptional regulator